MSSIISSERSDTGAGLFKGNLLTVCKSIPFSAMQFAVYDQAKDALLALRPHQGDLSQVLLAPIKLARLHLLTQCSPIASVMSMARSRCMQLSV